ncbi:MAG: NAD(P)-binding protein [Myxococcota bacterium]
MHVAVIGAGLGGLAAARMLREGGATVTVYERAGEPGGRARSQTHAGATLNLGPHALYTAGAASRVLARLGVTPRGAAPPNAGLALRRGALHALPATATSAVASTALALGEKLAVPGVLLGDPGDGTVADRLAGVPDGAADLVRALVRVSTYCNAPDAQAARAALGQVRLALRGVRYLDGGWQQLVDALAVPVEHADVAALPDADAVVIAGSPALARRLGVDVPELLPVRAACLDLVLDGLPRPDARFVLGLDAPLYLSEHGGIASLGGTVVHVARYLAPGEPGDAGSLEALLDLAQPGWRARVAFRRFLPELVVTHRVDRPGERVAGEHRVGGRPVHLVGDWVGEEGMLLDRALASAARAADALLRDAGRAAA